MAVPQPFAGRLRAAWRPPPTASPRACGRVPHRGLPGDERWNSEGRQGGRARCLSVSARQLQQRAGEPRSATRAGRQAWRTACPMARRKGLRTVLKPEVNILERDATKTSVSSRRRRPPEEVRAERLLRAMVVRPDMSRASGVGFGKHGFFTADGVRIMRRPAGRALVQRTPPRWARMRGKSEREARSSGRRRAGTAAHEIRYAIGQKP